MPTYSYKGHDFDVDHEPTAQEFQQMSAYVDSLPPKEPSLASKTIESARQGAMEGVTGTEEAARSLLTGLGAQLAAPIAVGTQALTAATTGKWKDFSAEKAYEQALQDLTYAPKTERGQEIMKGLGETINQLVIPVAPMVGVFGVGKTRVPKAEVKLTPEAMSKMVPEAPKTGTAALLEELNTKAPETGKTFPTASGTEYAQLTQQREALRQQKQTPEIKSQIDAISARLDELNIRNYTQEMRSRQLGFEAEAAQLSDALGSFERQVRQADRETPRTGIEPLFVTPEGEALFNPLFEDQQRVALAKQAADEQQRIAQESQMAQRSQLGVQEEMFGNRDLFELQQAGEMAAREVPPVPTEQRSLFEPYTNMHRAYEEFFAQTPEGVRPFSPSEFRTILENLSKEEGTAFQMPEDFQAAYKDYLNHATQGQGDLFGAHEVLQSTAHKTWGELTPQEKGKATKALNKIGPITESMQDRMLQSLAEEKDTGITYMRAGFTKEDMLSKIPGLKLRDVGVSMITSPEQAIELGKTSSDVSQGGLGKAMNALTKGGIFLSAKLKNPVVSYSVDKLLAADSVARAKISDNIHGTYAEALRRLSKDEMLQAKALLDAADLNQRPITPDLMQKYGLSTALQDFLGTHQLLMDDVLKSINEARQAVGKKPISPRVAYSAMSMTGDFRKVVTVDGITVGVIGANSTKGLETIQQKVMAKYPTAAFSKTQDMSVTQKGGKGSPHAAFMDILDMIGEETPHIQEFLDVLNQIAKDDATNYMGMQKHTMQKKGVWGMEGRKWWESEETNAKDFFANQVRYAESAYQWGELSRAAKEVNEVIRNPELVGKQDNAIKIVEEYMQNALGINPSRVGKAVNEFMNSAFGAAGIGPSIPRAMVSGMRTVANTFMLSLSPVFLGMQVVQAPTVMPALSAFLRGRGAAPLSTALTMGFGHFTQGGWTLTKKLLGQELSSVEKGAFDYAQKHHVYATDMVEHANQIQKGVGFYTTKLTQTPAAIVEQSTRAQVYMALVHMMNDAGVKPAQGLYEQAARFTDMAMVNYGALEKPSFYNSLGPIGSLAYNLKSFTHNELSRWSMYAREIAETKNPFPLLTQMATTIAIAGVFGLPFYSQFEELYDFITKKLGKPRSLTLDVMDASKQMGKHLGPNGQYALSNGAPTMLGVDLSTRLGLGDVVPSSAGEAAFAGGGKLYEMGKATGRAMLSPSEANLKAAAINLAPPVAQGPLDIAWYQKDNLAMSKNPEKPAKAVARRTDTDVLLKKIGLTGINESAQKQRVYQQDQLDKAYTSYRTDAMNAISWELMNGQKPSDKNLDKYFKTGQGDPETFVRDIERIVINQRLSPEEAIALRQAASQRVPQIQSFLRRAQ